MPLTQSGEIDEERRVKLLLWLLHDADSVENKALRSATISFLSHQHQSRLYFRVALIRYPCPPGFRTLHPCNYTGHEKRRTFRPPRYSINAKPYVNITRISCKVGNSSSQRSITCNPFPSLPASMPLFSLCLLSFFIAKIRSRLHNAEQSHIAT